MGRLTTLEASIKFVATRIGCLQTSWMGWRNRLQDAALGVTRWKNTAEGSSQGSCLYAHAGEARRSCHDCWFQNQTILAATRGFRSYIQSCWLQSYALPAGATPARRTPGRLPPFTHNSVLDSSLVQVHLVADIKSPPEPWLQESPGTVICSFLFSAIKCIRKME